MNSSEKLETSIHTPEEQQLPKNPEGGFEIDDEQKFEQRRDETLGDVESRASQTKEDGIARLDRTSHSYDLPAEDIASIRQESQVDEKLKSNSDEIDQLTQSTTEQIKSVGETPKSEQAPGAREGNVEKERTIEGFQEKRGAILTNVLTSETVNSGLNLVPFAGGGKMLVESISGKELSGHKLSGKERIVHGAIGAGSLALDFTGIGEVSKAGVLAGRSVGLVEKVGAGLATKGAVRSARIFEKTAEFMVKHPDLTAKAELYADSKIRGVVTQIKDYQREARPVEEVQTPESVVESPPIPEGGLEDSKVVDEKIEQVEQTQAPEVPEKKAEVVEKNSTTATEATPETIEGNIGGEVGEAYEKFLEELKVATPDVSKIKSSFSDLEKKISNAQMQMMETSDFDNPEYSLLKELRKKAESEISSKFKKLFEEEMSSVGKSRTETSEVSSEQVEKNANYEGDHSELLVERLSDPEINSQLAHMIYLDRKYDLSILEVPTLEEVRAKEQATISAISEYTPITFSGEMPSANTLDDVRENMDIYFNNPEVFGENGIRQKNITESHEKGHTVRKIRSEAAQEYFKKGFDFNSMTIPPERLEKIRDYFHKLDLESPAPTDAQVHESIASYFSNPMELAERMSQLKNYFGMKGTEVFTKGHLDYARKNYVTDTKMDNHMSEFFQIITPETEGAFLEIINGSGI